MEHVLGIGGYFIRATDPGALTAWYRDCLGVEVGEMVAAQGAMQHPDGNSEHGRADQIGQHGAGTCLPGPQLGVTVQPLQRPDTGKCAATVRVSVAIHPSRSPC